MSGERLALAKFDSRQTSQLFISLFSGNDLTSPTSASPVRPTIKTNLVWRGLPMEWSARGHHNSFYTKQSWALRWQLVNPPWVVSRHIDTHRSPYTPNYTCKTHISSFKYLFILSFSMYDCKQNSLFCILSSYFKLRHVIFSSSISLNLLWTLARARNSSWIQWNK